MEYREYAAGTRISALGFGCMRLPEIEKNGSWYIDDEKALPLLREAARLGVNYFDTAPGYCHTNSEISVGRALKPIRPQVYISTKFLWTTYPAGTIIFACLKKASPVWTLPILIFIISGA